MNRPFWTLEEWNRIRSQVRAETDDRLPNGIACPKCKAEMYDVPGGPLLLTCPPKVPVRCPECDHSDSRVA